MNKKIILGTVGVTLAVAVPSLAFAADQSVGVVAGNIGRNFDDITKLLKGGALLGGTGFAIGAALKFKEHNENPNQVKLSQPITKALVGGALLSLGTWMDVLTGTATDTNADTEATVGLDGDTW